jgi:hypothetical protein
VEKWGDESSAEGEQPAGIRPGVRGTWRENAREKENGKEWRRGLAETRLL